MGRIREIDGLRALAALLVFAHHTFGFPLIARFTGAGWVGVDLFFVISGYLITTILLGMRGSPGYFKNFYMRRTLRIFPPYYFFFALCALVAIFSTRYQFSGKLWSAFFFYATSLVALRPWFAGAVSQLPGPVKAMNATWSVSIEELFYLLWAPAVRYLRRRNLVALVMVVIAVAPPIRWYLRSIGPLAESWSFPARMDGLAFGALLALWQSSGRRFAVPGWTVIAGLIACSCWLFGPSNAQLNKWFALFGYSTIEITMCLVLAFVLEHAESDKLLCVVLRSKWLVRVGTISYMFYLLHGFMVVVFRDLFAGLAASHWMLGRMLQLTGSLAATLLLSDLSWRYFESPILSLKSRFVSRTTKDAPSLQVAITPELAVAQSERIA